MPFFKSTYNILKKPDEDEVFDPNWMDSNTLILPETKVWDYKRELKLEDIDIWEVIVEHGTIGVYAAWQPYAEFYLIITGTDYSNQWLGQLNGVTYNYSGKIYETYYGAGAQKMVQKRMIELNIPFSVNKVWVDESEMWMFEQETENKNNCFINNF